VARAAAQRRRRPAHGTSHVAVAGLVRLGRPHSPGGGWVTESAATMGDGGWRSTGGRSEFNPLAVKSKPKVETECVLRTAVRACRFDPASRKSGV
jgi:hypothetical protein